MYPSAIRIPIELHDIIETRADSLRVEFCGGRRAWLPRDEIEMTPGTVWVPVWLARKMGIRQPATRSN